MAVANSFRINRLTTARVDNAGLLIITQSVDLIHWTPHRKDTMKFIRTIHDRHTFQRNFDKLREARLFIVNLTPQDPSQLTLLRQKVRLIDDVIHFFNTQLLEHTNEMKEKIREGKEKKEVEKNTR